MFIHEDTIKWALESLKDYDSAPGIKLNRYIGLIALSKICGESIIPLKTYPVVSSKLSDSLNHVFTTVSARPSTSNGVIYLTFGANWHEDGVKNFLKSQRPPLIQLAILCHRDRKLSSATADNLISDFVSSYNIPISEKEKLNNTIQIQTTDNPVSNSKFIEISESIFGAITASKRTYTPSGFVVSAAGEIDRGPYTQPLLNQAEIFGIVKMTRSKEQNSKQLNRPPLTSAHPDRNVIPLRLISALTAKPFAILAGGTGTGKTRAARQVAIQFAGNANACTIAVGADWTDNRPLLGFRNLLAEDGKTYVAPPALRIILKALRNPGSPHFLILDEMNLSHVERYFADFLSSMESKEPLKLHDCAEALKTEDGISVEGEVAWPSNLFVIGTVNIDETTYMFSPKVLDRAHVIEFKVAWEEIEGGLEGAVPNEAVTLTPEQVQEFMRVAQLKDKALSEEDHDSLIDVLRDMHKALDGSRFVFAHRTARECLNFSASTQALAKADIVPPQDIKDLIDLAILQKALPKLNGAAGTLSKVLEDLIKVSDMHDLTLCKEKLESMSRQLKADQFVSFIQ